MSNKIRVLIVEDSALMRKIISDIISSDPQIEIVDKAKNGKEAMEKVFALKPDVVTLDVNLPSIDGLAVLRQIMQKQPTRVIMLSAYTRRGTVTTITALESGAIDFIPKPSGELSTDLYKLKDEIIFKIKMVAGVDLQRFLSTLKRPVTLKPKEELAPAEIKKLVVIGASTGGPKAILQIMHTIPSDVPAVFLIVQHMPEGFTLSFAERVSWESGLKAKEAEAGDVISLGKVYIAPGGYHMSLRRFRKAAETGLRIELDQNPPVNFVRPSIDVTMDSATEIFGSNMIGVILTGMGKDGLNGVRRIKEKGGMIIVQDESTSVVWGMPKMVVDAGLADYVLPLGQIAAVIIENIKRVNSDKG